MKYFITLQDIELNKISTMVADIDTVKFWLDGCEHLPNYKIISIVPAN